MENTKIISSWQLILLVLCSRMMTVYTYMPVLQTPPANQDVWIVALLSSLYTIVISVPILYITNTFRGINFTKTLQMITNKFIGKIFAILFVSFFFFCNIACLVLAVVFVNSSIFPETPPLVIMLFIMVPCVYIVYKGLEILSRVSTIIVSYVLITIVIFFLLSLNQMNFGNLKPILSDSTFLNLNIGAILTALRFSDLVVFAVLASYLKDEVNINKSFLTTLLIFTVFFLITVIPTITSLGIGVAQHSWNPYFMLTREVNLYDFIQRVEVFNVTAWMSASIIKLSLHLYMTTTVLAQVFNSKTHNYYTLPITVVILVASIYLGIDKSSVVDFLRSYMVFPFIVLFFIVILPVILSAIYLIRRKNLKPTIELAKKNM